MAKPAPIYRKLPGVGRSLIQYVRLYEGPDHLLQVYSTGYSETYRRFYYRDIQALTIVRSNAWLIWLSVWGVLMGLFVVIAWGDKLPWLWPVSGVFALFLLLSLIAGPGCVCTIQTPVQTERLPSLHRVWRLHAFLARVQPLIAAAQTREVSAAPAPNAAAPEGEPAEVLPLETGPAEAIPAAALSGEASGANSEAGL